MDKKFIFSGVSGVGKDYTLDRLKDSGYFFQKINMGKLILDEMIKNATLDFEKNIDKAYEVARRTLMRNIGRTVLSLYNVYGENLQDLRSNYDRIGKLDVEDIKDFLEG